MLLILFSGMGEEFKGKIMSNCILCRNSIAGAPIDVDYQNGHHAHDVIVDKISFFGSEISILGHEDVISGPHGFRALSHGQR